MSKKQAQPDFKKAGYYIISSEIKLTQDLSIPLGSVLDFRGGFFSGNAKLDLKGCPIRAPHTGIFAKDIEVANLGGNPAVYAEWFNLGYSDNTCGDEDFINRALEAAKGIPVVLENKTYHLNKPIYLGPYIKVKKVDGKDTYIEHNITSKIGTFTLICPGTLKLNSDTSAIALGYKNLRLQVNQIEGPDLTETREETLSSDSYKGTGLRFYDNVYHADIDVISMTNLNKGISVILDKRPKEDSDVTVSGERIAGTQYLKFNFRSIKADYCIYSDLDKTSGIAKWFNECQINGGRLDGRYGIYKLSNNNAFNGNIFRTIELGNLSEAAIQTDTIEFSYFSNLNTINQLPSEVGNKWIKLRDSYMTRMSFLDRINPYGFEFDKECDRTVISAPLTGIDSQGLFDTIAVNDITVKTENSDNTPLVALASSVHPFNIAKTVTRNPDKELLTLSDLFPKVECENPSLNLSVDCDVLPSMVLFDVNAAETLRVDIGGLKDVSPSFQDFYARIGAGGSLVLTGTNQLLPIRFLRPETGSILSLPSLTIKQTGLYKMGWDEDGHLLVHKVS